MDRMNGGYALLDLIKYDLRSSIIESADDLENAVELTEREYNEIILLIENSYEHSKPLIVKAFLYDSTQICQPLSFHRKTTNAYISSYRDVEDKEEQYLVISKINNKYYIYCSNSAFIG